MVKEDDEMNTTTCETNHLTSFAVLIQVKPVEVSFVEKIIASVFSYFLLSISFLFLLATLILFCIGGRTFLKVEMNILYLNYGIALTCANGLFLFGVELGKFHPVSCTIVALFLHYFWSTVFSWSLCNAILIFYRLFIGILSNRKIWPYLVFFGWLSPLPLVIISVSIKQSAYSNHLAGYCWLSNEDGLIWAFLGPVFLVLILNAIILTTSAIRIGTARKNLDKVKQLRVALLSAFILTPVLGMPWIVSFAKIITVGIEDELALAILDRFIDWVFICLNAPAGVVFFIIIFKRFREHRQSLRQKGTAGTISVTSPSASDFSKFRKIHQSTSAADASFTETTSITGYKIRHTNSNASMISQNSNSCTNLMKGTSTSTTRNKSLFDDKDNIGIYSTLDSEYMHGLRQKRTFSTPNRSSLHPDRAYEVSSLRDLSRVNSRDGIEMETIRERKVSNSCDLTYDNPYEQESDNVKLTADNDDDGTKNFFSRGIEFLNNSFKTFRDKSLDTEANKSSTPTPYTESDSKYHNIYLEHLHKVTERTQSNPEMSVEDAPEPTTLGGEKIRRKSTPSSYRLSCEHTIKVNELKQYFDDTAPKLPIANQQLSISESDKDTIPVIQENDKPEVGHPLMKQYSSPKRELNPLPEPEKNEIELSIDTKHSINSQEDNVFNLPSPKAISTFEPISSEPRQKMSSETVLRKTNSLGYIGTDDIKQRRSTDALGEQNISKVGHHVKCFEDIIRTNSAATQPAPPPKRAHSTASINRNKIDVPSSMASFDPNIPEIASLNSIDNSQSEQHQKRCSVDDQITNL
ncbi:Adhesion G-protein coupled receptor D1-like isoform X2 [Oopsacas minuta]|uniref:Adhesion G-protein coupled receptor D1-like isoform X2 n=1 Tax=Oopsacas minuta TaxID=111878 RepID=A0AAV7KKV3_9METZ|nr:Adhesion G-protein coupled receptor D1-like isoform X2 [Oopsacas minuta]